MINYSYRKLNKNIFFTPDGFTLYLNFNAENNQYQISNNNLNQGKTINKVQSVYIDNSQSSVTTTINVLNTAQNIYVPPYSILSWPIMISQNDLITFSNNSTENILVTVILTDRNLPAVEYSAIGNLINGNFTIAGNLTVNQDSNFIGFLKANGGLQTTSAAMTNGTVSNIFNVLGEIVTPKITTDTTNTTSATNTRLNVTSSATISKLTVNSALINALLEVAGATNLHGLLTASNGINTNNVNTTSLATLQKLDVVSNATIHGSLTTSKGINTNTVTTNSLATLQKLDVVSNATIHGMIELTPTVYTGATAGTASALPTLPAGYFELSINGTNYKLPYYGT